MSETKCNVEVFSRVVGFFRPVQSWNKGKTEEFKDRNEYNLAAAEEIVKHDNSRIAKSLAG